MRVELLHWAESVLKYLVQFGIILLEGTGAVILLSVSYTHLTLPTKVLV